MTRVVDLLQYLLAERGSDLLVKVGSPPAIRRNGKLERSNLEALSPTEIEALAKEMLTPVKAEEFQRTGETDLAHSVPGLGRFRVNVYRQRGSVSLAIRRAVPGAPAIADLGVPRGGRPRRAARWPGDHLGPGGLGEDDHRGGDDRPHQRHAAAAS
ncbi:MAG: hypothetical protein R2701_01405 [Acidimicrobiales bacterium]